MRSAFHNKEMPLTAARSCWKIYGELSGKKLIHARRGKKAGALKQTRVDVDKPSPPWRNAFGSKQREEAAMT